MGHGTTKGRALGLTLFQYPDDDGGHGHSSDLHVLGEAFLCFLNPFVHTCHCKSYLLNLPMLVCLE
jgi:hypothetical protein